MFYNRNLVSEPRGIVTGALGRIQGLKKNFSYEGHYSNIFKKLRFLKSQRTLLRIETNRHGMSRFVNIFALQV